MILLIYPLLPTFHIHNSVNSSVVYQNMNSQNNNTINYFHKKTIKNVLTGFLNTPCTSLKTEVIRKQSAPNFRKANVSYPLIRTSMYAYPGVRNVCFSKNLACFVFLLPPFWNLSFPLALSPIKHSIKLVTKWYLS